MMKSDQALESNSLENSVRAVARDTNSLARLTATEFLQALKAKDIQAIDYVRACADLIDTWEPHLHAWAWYDRERFEAHGIAADLTLKNAVREGADDLPYRMLGVPIGVKDIYNTDDMPTSHGSALFEDYTPGNDARVVTNLKREAAIMAGKTVTAEFAVHTQNGTVNPWDFGRSAGTSSSGSAAAVSSGMVPIALGSQTAGSIIRPASYCGIYGFKPSYGTIPRTAMLKTTDTLDSVGFMSRSVPDLSLMFEMLRVRGLNYPIVDRELDNPGRLKSAARPWRVGCLSGPKSSLTVSEVNRTFAVAVQRLEDAGCQVEQLTLPEMFADSHRVHDVIYNKSLSYYFRMEWERGQHTFSPRLAAMIAAGVEMTVEDYLDALKSQTSLAKAFDSFMADYDVLICPSTADEAPEGFESLDIPDHCLIFTLCYAPALSIPVLTGSIGLPVGLQIVARRFDDYKVLDFAAFAEGVLK